MPYEDEAAPMGGQMDSQTVTVEALTDAVSASVTASVSENVAGMLADVAGRIDGLENGLQAVSAQVQAVSDSAATQSDLQVVSASLSASLEQVEQAALQAGEVGPVLGDEEIGPVIISLIGDLLEVLDTDEDGASDVLSVVEEIRGGVQDIAATLVHPAMSTPFNDYSVIEALLLLLVLWLAVIKPCLSMLGGGFGWLRR